MRNYFDKNNFPIRKWLTRSKIGVKMLTKPESVRVRKQVDIYSENGKI